MIAAASGDPAGAPDEKTVKTWKKHGRVWFKSRNGGRELAAKAYILEAMPSLRPILASIVDAVRSATATVRLDTRDG